MIYRMMGYWLVATLLAVFIVVVFHIKGYYHPWGLGFSFTIIALVIGMKIEKII